LGVGPRLSESGNAVDMGQNYGARLAVARR
jgi:hypothetical protein